MASATACPALCCCRRPLRTRPVTASPAAPVPPDPASASSFQLYRLHHFHLGLELRPESRELAGCLVLELSCLLPGGPALVLDTHPATRVSSVRCRRTGGGEGESTERFYPQTNYSSTLNKETSHYNVCSWALEETAHIPHEDCLALPKSPCSPQTNEGLWVEEFTDYGSALNISVPENLRTSETFQVIIHYITGEGPAVWWLDPELSYGGSQLFVFTQGHSVCNRSFFPCFDTPAVKCTYSASVKAPSGIRVLMSCTHSYFIEEIGVSHFYMEHPVPAYLVALTAGHLLPADIGPRSRVWAEPCVLQLAVSKLAGRVEQWLQAAESLYGPYIWGRYDIVFLPPSFPIVAMENPCLTFVICSILDSEDFLLIDVIHEIAHGWFGNAVTNASWEEMWLSEGLATYAQRRITTRVYGAAFTCLETTFRLEALHRQIRILGQDTPLSRLQAKLDPGVNPSNLMNLFTYEKGFCFVHYLSQICGDPDNFDAFLREYIEKFKFRSVVANELLESYLHFFPHLRDETTGRSEGLEFERWLNAPGPPLSQPDLSQGSVYTAPVETLSQLWMSEPLDVEAASSFANISDWQTFQTVLFLDKLLDKSPLRPEVMMQLSLCYSADLATMNTEIRIRWLQIVVRNNFQPDLPQVRHFLLCQTSRMYTIPLYEDLISGPLKSCALEIFYQTHGRLHPNLRKTIQQILAQGGSVVQPESAVPVLATELCAQSPASLRDVNVTA
uniref:Peptidase M1 leukotriene A4 hydrolase/aminopeptidase C-terminal domain-containing protein n=1 Tax=Xenopus tropicalis TaxID=8364 RepID=A0A6I8T0I2_XENTR